MRLNEGLSDPPPYITLGVEWYSNMVFRASQDLRRRSMETSNFQGSGGFEIKIHWVNFYNSCLQIAPFRAIKTSRHPITLAQDQYHPSKAPKIPPYIIEPNKGSCIVRSLPCHQFLDHPGNNALPTPHSLHL